MNGIPVEQQGEMIGLGVLISVGAVIVGYIVKTLMPDQHFSWTSGLLAANAVVAGFAYTGIKVAGIIIIWWLVMSIFVGMFTLMADFDLRWFPRKKR